LEFSKTISMPVAGAVALHYSMGKQSLSLQACDSAHICYDCLYDLTISVTGDCSGGVSGKNDTTLMLKNFPLWRVDTSCVFALPGTDVIGYVSRIGPIWKL